MKLLFDHNLSPVLVSRLQDIYPDSSHVHLLGLDTALDTEIWQYVRQEEFLIVTKDADYSELCMMRGFPPKVVWIRRATVKPQVLKHCYEAIRVIWK